LTPAVDCWAAGLVLFILLTGGVPFDEDEVEGGKGGQAAASSIKSLEVKRAAEGMATPALLRGLMEMDPAKRLTASEALDDTWLQLAEEVQTLQPPATYDYAVKMSKLSCERCERVPLKQEGDGDSSDGTPSGVKENRCPVDSEDSTDDSDGRDNRLDS
jgi:serine/threonine protein kinase